MRRKILMLFFVVWLLGGCQAGTTPVVPTETPLVGKLTFTGSTTIQPLAAQLGDAFHQRHPRVTLDIAGGGSLVGIQAVHEGTVDIGMASRRLTAQEALGIESYQIASDVIAVVVHPQNPVAGLTLEQVRGIYRGEIVNWREVGGPDLEIIPVTREKSSGTRGAFDELALEKQEPSAPRLTSAITAGDMAVLVAREPAAIGYVGFGNLEENLKVLTIDGITPSKDTALNGQYPLVRPLNLLTGPLSQPLSKVFIEFVLSPDGQKLVEEAGWVAMK